MLVFENKQNAFSGGRERGRSSAALTAHMLQTGGMFCKQRLYKQCLLGVFFHTRQVGCRRGTVGRIAEHTVFMGCLLSFHCTCPYGPDPHLGDVIHTRSSLNQRNLNSNPRSGVN